MRRLLTVIVLASALMLGVLVSTAGAQDDYTPIQVGGTVAVRGTSARLPFTGSSHTTSFVLIGLGALALGGALVVAGRRRGEVLQQS